MKASSREKIYETLRQRVRGDVLVDEKTLTRYATDQSIYEICLLAVVVPRQPPPTFLTYPLTCRASPIARAMH